MHNDHDDLLSYKDPFSSGHNLVGEFHSPRGGFHTLSAFAALTHVPWKTFDSPVLFLPTV